MKPFTRLTTSFTPSSSLLSPPSSCPDVPPYLKMGFSLCPCFGSSPQTKDFAHRSYVRVVDPPPPYHDQRIVRMPEKMRSTVSFEPLIEFSEKEIEIQTVERPPSSSSSSIVSMPSTHLTSNPTGSTVARDSLVATDTGSTAPPSYRSGSRSPSPPLPSTLLLHPVMSDDWFRRLQQRALDATTRSEGS